MLQDATFWVALAFVIFVALVYKKAAALITNALDQRGIRIRQELDEAQRLRDDAQAVLAAVQKRLQEAEAEAEKILVYAREEAERIHQRAEADVQVAVKRREAQALDRIAQAESQAITDIRNMAADVAIGATRRLFEERLESGQSDPLLDASIANLEAALKTSARNPAADARLN